MTGTDRHRKRRHCSTDFRPLRIARTAIPSVTATNTGITQATSTTKSCSSASTSALPPDARVTETHIGHAAAAIAPYAIANHRTVGMRGTDRPILVKGNADAIADAVRNLVENAIAHSPSEEEIGVAYLATGASP
jgi:K+-sensing histidine kinase KdpD